MIKSIGNFLSDFGLPIFFVVVFGFIITLIFLADADAMHKDEFCLVQQQVVVKYHGASYCADLTSLNRAK
jgi:hypothetical protein